MYTLAIIGGGASGMMAALTAAERGHRVTLFERQARVGKKLLATGNGRCNLTNMNAKPASYHGEDAGFMSYALSRFQPWQVREYFRALGLVTVEELSGRVYPFSDTAGSVVDVLRFALAALGVELRTGIEIASVRASRRGFVLDCGGESFNAERLIIAAGGAAGVKVGGGTRGYELLMSLGHTRTALHPSLTQIHTASDYPRSLKGVRADSGVVLLKNGKPAAESAGEVQFVEYGVSGPAAFEISRAASVSGGELVLRLDLMRGFTDAGLYELLKQRRGTLPELTSENLLTGILHNRLGQCVVRYSGRRLTDTIGQLTDGDLRDIARCIKCFELPVTGVSGFESAQVTAGGIRTSEFYPETLESRIVPGLFVCGEVLDIDGDCGGFNLQWAWSSGRLAGRLGERS